MGTRLNNQVVINILKKLQKKKMGAHMEKQMTAKRKWDRIKRTAKHNQHVRRNKGKIDTKMLDIFAVCSIGKNAALIHDLIALNRTEILLRE